MGRETDGPPAGARTATDGPDGEGDERTTWILFGLLAVAIVGVILFFLLRDDDDGTDVATDDETEVVDEGAEEPAPAEEPDAAEGADDPAADDPVPPAGAPGTPGVGGTPDDAADPATLADDDPGELRAGDESLLPVPDDLAALVDEEVEGFGVLVDEVVEAVGFWVGTEDDRIFVRVAPGLDTGDFEVEEGARIDLQGVVRVNDPAAAEPDDDQGGELYREQGHHIELRAVRPAS